MPAPPFGTASAYTDSFPSPPPRQVTISAETCYNLGIFKDMVRQYRRLDDQIITRLNRASAQLRDQNRLSTPFSSTSSSYRSTSPTIDNNSNNNTMCIQIWSEIMAGWAHRQTMLSYCLNTVKSSISQKVDVQANPIGAGDMGDIPVVISPVRVGRTRGVKEEEVLADQLSQEESIEAIIRKRTLDAFRSRCPFFTPPPDSPGKAWWDLASAGRPGRGPDLP